MEQGGCGCNLHRLPRGSGIIGDVFLGDCFLKPGDWAKVLAEVAELRREVRRLYWMMLILVAVIWILIVR